MSKRKIGSTFEQLDLPFGTIKNKSNADVSNGNVVLFSNIIQKTHNIKVLKKRKDNIDKLIDMAQSLKW